MNYGERTHEVEQLDRLVRQQISKRRRDIKTGWWMAVFLAVGTVVEYVLAVELEQNLPLMIAINVAEAAAILVYFMHLPRVWHGAHTGDKEEGAW